MKQINTGRSKEQNFHSSSASASGEAKVIDKQTRVWEGRKKGTVVHGALFKQNTSKLKQSLMLLFLKQLGRQTKLALISPSSREQK